MCVGVHGVAYRPMSTFTAVKFAIVYFLPFIYAYFIGKEHTMFTLNQIIMNNVFFLTILICSKFPRLKSDPNMSVNLTEIYLKIYILVIIIL